MGSGLSSDVSLWGKGAEGGVDLAVAVRGSRERVKGEVNSGAFKEGKQ